MMTGWPTVSRLMRRPVVVAPMAGGPTTVDLVIAASSAGALGFLAAGYKTAAAMRAEMDAVEAGGAGPYGVNVFVPGAPAPDPAGVARYVAGLAAGQRAAWSTASCSTTRARLAHIPRSTAPPGRCARPPWPPGTRTGRACGPARASAPPPRARPRKW